MGSFSGILVVGPPNDPHGKTHFLARKNPNVWGDCPANQLASPSPQASLFGVAYATQAKCIDREGLGTRRTGTKQRQRPMPAGENSQYYSIEATTGFPRNTSGGVAKCRLFVCFFFFQGAFAASRNLVADKKTVT